MRTFPGCVLPILAALALTASACDEPVPDGTVDGDCADLTLGEEAAYDADIQPIFDTYCVLCHASDVPVEGHEGRRGAPKEGTREAQGEPKRNPREAQRGAKGDRGGLGEKPKQKGWQTEREEEMERGRERNKKQKERQTDIQREGASNKHTTNNINCKNIKSSASTKINLDELL